MRFNLQDLVKKAEKTVLEVKISDRLPSFISEPCTVSLSFSLKKQDDYYLLHLKTEAKLDISCQRCSHNFQIPYQNETELAICNNEARAETLLSLYECIVAENDQLSLEDIITDELYLYAPQFHPNAQDCDKIVQQFISDSAIN